MDGKKKTIKLDYPLEIAGKRYEEITLGRLRAKHLRGINIKADGTITPDKMIPLIAHSANLGVAIIEELDAGDFVTLMAEVADFLAPGPQIGGNA